MGVSRDNEFDNAFLHPNEVDQLHQGGGQFGCWTDVIKKEGSSNVGEEGLRDCPVTEST